MWKVPWTNYKELSVTFSGLSNKRGLCLDKHHSDIPITDRSTDMPGPFLAFRTVLSTHWLGHVWGGCSLQWLYQPGGAHSVSHWCISKCINDLTVSKILNRSHGWLQRRTPCWEPVILPRSHKTRTRPPCPCLVRVGVCLCVLGTLTGLCTDEGGCALPLGERWHFLDVVSVA